MKGRSLPLHTQTPEDPRVGPMDFEDHLPSLCLFTYLPAKGRRWWRWESSCQMEQRRRKRNGQFAGTKAPSPETDLCPERESRLPMVGMLSSHLCSFPFAHPQREGQSCAAAGETLAQRGFCEKIPLPHELTPKRTCFTRSHSTTNSPLPLLA